VSSSRRPIVSFGIRVDDLVFCENSKGHVFVRGWRFVRSRLFVRGRCFVRGCLFVRGRFFMRGRLFVRDRLFVRGRINMNNLSRWNWINLAFRINLPGPKLWRGFYSNGINEHVFIFW